MKWITLLFMVCLFSCSTKNPVSSSDSGNHFANQEGTVEAYVISRGSFQYVISVEKGGRKGKYLPEDLDKAYCRDGLKVKFDAEFLQKAGTIYKPGPTDVPEKDFEAPMIRILSISKL